MYKLDLNYTPNPFFIRLVKRGIFCALILMHLCFFMLEPIFGEVTDTSQFLDSSRETGQQKTVFKIEYFIDNLAIKDSEKLSTLEKLTHIAVNSQFSRNAIQQSVNSLFSSQQFAQIDVYILQTSEGIVLKFDLKNVMRIQKSGITGELPERLRQEIQAAIKLKPGAKYVPVISKKDIDAIKKVCAENGYYDAEVKANTITSDGSLTYHVNLGNPTVVKKIQIQGNSAIFTEQIIATCKTRVGSVYRKAILDQDIEVIRGLYEKKYYPSTEIAHDFRHQTGVLTLDILEGTQLLLDFVDENGKPIIQDAPFRIFLAKLGFNIKESERDRLRNEITFLINNRSLWEETVQDHFEAEGYHGTEVKSKILTNSPLHVEFTVKRGIRYIVTRVTFSGSSAFSDRELLREIEMKPYRFFSRLFRKRIFSQQKLLTDIQRLKILYEKAGYPYTEIDTDIKFPSFEELSPNRQKRGEITIHFKIVADHREVINRCQFNGNKALDTTTLLDALPSRSQEPNARLVRKKYENAILKAYQDRGYIDARIVNTQYLHKTETPVLVVEGNFSEQLDSGTLPKKLRDAFKEHNLPLAGTKIGEEWSIQDFDGNARYTLEQRKEHLSVFEHGVLQFQIFEGDQIIFGTFSFVGEIGVKPIVLKREFTHLRGALYVPEKISKAIANLYNTGVFERIRAASIIPAAFGNQPSNFGNASLPILSAPQPVIRDVEIRLQKRKARAIGASVGYSTSDGPRGTIALSHYNLLKRNVRFRLRGRQGTLGYLYDTTLTEPWLIGRTSGSLQFLARKLEEDDDVRALQGSFSLSRKLSNTHRLNLEYSYRDLKDTSVAFLETTVSSLRFLWRQDTRVPSLNPTSGMLNEAAVEIAGNLLGGKSSFIKITTDTRYHRRLNARGLVLATALRLGYTPGLQAKANNEAELISFERFWAGGSTTVRGYAERGLGPKDSPGKYRGNVQFIFNTELRFPIFDPIQGVVFFDTGNVWDTVADIEYKWLPSAAGVGLRLSLGPFIGGVDYAVPLISVPDVSTNAIYGRIGTTF